MKKFDKGYIYSALISDLITCFVLVFIFLDDLLLGDESSPGDIATALPIFITAFIVIYLCFIVYRILYYNTSGYELTEKEIICKRGVLLRKRSVLDYKNVHAINKRQTLFHRIFGIAVLTVDSGSANTAHRAEITIIEKDKVASDLLLTLTSLRDSGSAPKPPSAEQQLLISDKDSLYRFTSGKKMLYTLINIAYTAFLTAIFAVSAIVVMGACKLMLQQNIFGSWGNFLLYAFLITVGAMLLFSVISLIACLVYSFVGYYDFRITKLGGDIQISYGLLEKHTNTFSYDRIKAVKITQGLMQRMFGFASIHLEVIGYTNSADDDNKNAGIGVLVPFCKYDEIGEILAKVLPDYVPDKKQTKSVSYFPFISWFTLILGIVLATVILQAAVPMLILDVPASIVAAVVFAVVGLGAVILAVKALGAALCYQNSGLAVSGDKITAYYGGFTKNVTVFMSRNLIAVEDMTTPLRQKAGIKSLVMHIKTNEQYNEIAVHIQKSELSDDLEKLLIL